MSVSEPSEKQQKKTDKLWAGRTLSFEKVDRVLFAKKKNLELVFHVRIAFQNDEKCRGA